MAQEYDQYNKRDSFKVFVFICQVIGIICFCVLIYLLLKPTPVSSDLDSNKDYGQEDFKCVSGAQAWRERTVFDISQSEVPEKYSCDQLKFIVRNQAYPESIKRSYAWNSTDCGFEIGEIVFVYSDPVRERVKSAFDDYYLRMCLT